MCEEPGEYLALDDACRLGETIRVSQRGFDRPAAATYDTLEIVTEWNQLLVAIDRLQQHVEGAGAGVGVRDASTSL